MLTFLNFSAKAEEKDNQIPRNSDIVKLLNNTYEIGDLARVELSVLQFFDWDVHHPTVAHFVGYFTAFAIFPSDVAEHEDTTTQLFKLHCALKTYLDYFVDASLKGKSCHGSNIGGSLTIFHHFKEKKKCFSSTEAIWK